MMVKFLLDLVVRFLFANDPIVQVLRLQIPEMLVLITS